MAYYYTDEMQILTGQRDKRMSAGHVFGTVRQFYFNLSMNGLPVALWDRLYLARLPAGSRIVGGWVEILSPFGGSGGSGSNGRIRTAADSNFLTPDWVTSLDGTGLTLNQRRSFGVGKVVVEDAPGLGYSDIFLQITSIDTPATSGALQGVILFSGVQ